MVYGEKKKKKEDFAVWRKPVRWSICGGRKKTRAPDW